MQNQKKADPKKGHYRTSPLKNGLTKLPCFLKILVSWGDFFDNGLLLYPVQDHTMQCCTRKPFWVAKLEPQSCSASSFPYFEADAELGVVDRNKYIGTETKCKNLTNVWLLVPWLSHLILRPCCILFGQKRTDDNFCVFLAAKILFVSVSTTGSSSDNVRKSTKLASFTF